jgi:hypothetical protein
MIHGMLLQNSLSVIFLAVIAWRAPTSVMTCMFLRADHIEGKGKGILKTHVPSFGFKQIR